MSQPEHDAALDLLEERHLNTRWGVWTERAFLFGKQDIIALTLGNWAGEEEVPIRIHSTCFSAHYLESTECDCREQLEAAYELIAAHGKGALIFLEQDGRDNGHVALMRAAQYAKRFRSTQSAAYSALGYPADNREYRGAALVASRIGIRRALLLTNNPTKIAALEERGIVVAHQSHLASASGETARRFYRDKALEGYLIEPELP